MAADSIVLDDFVFYINAGEVAVGLSDIEINAQKAVYDGKNMLYLKSPNDMQYILQNIVPEVREALKKAKAVTIILLKNGDCQEAYELSLQTDENLFGNDTFFDEAENLNRYAKKKK